jgi:hypothetical protein
LFFARRDTFVVLWITWFSWNFNGSSNSDCWEVWARADQQFNDGKLIESQSMSFPSFNCSSA